MSSPKNAYEGNDAVFIKTAKSFYKMHDLKAAKSETFLCFLEPWDYYASKN